MVEATPTAAMGFTESFESGISDVRCDHYGNSRGANVPDGGVVVDESRKIKDSTFMVTRLAMIHVTSSNQPCMAEQH